MSEENIQSEIKFYNVYDHVVFEADPVDASLYDEPGSSSIRVGYGYGDPGEEDYINVAIKKQSTSDIIQLSDSIIISGTMTLTSAFELMQKISTALKNLGYEHEKTN